MMRSVLPRVFHPNRQPVSDMTAAGRRGFQAAELAALVSAVQGGVLSNLGALLAGQRPVALTAQDLAGLTRQPQRPRRRWARRNAQHVARSVTQLAPDTVAALLHHPQSLPELAKPGPDFGADILLRAALSQAFTDPVFLHRVAEACRKALCEKVLFHPGPPPQPVFSVRGLGLLIASQPGHRFAPDSDYALLTAALAEFVEPCRPWDQWLLRCMGKAPGWTVPPDLSGLPWIIWTPEAGFDRADALAAGLPAYWPSILDLDP